MCIRDSIKTHDHLLPHQHRWSAEVTRWAEHHFQQFLLGGLRFLQVDFHDLFAFGGIDRGRTRNQLECFRLLMNVFFSIDDDFGLDARVCKKLLRFRTSLSAFAVVVPVNFLGHCSFLLI